MTNSATNAVTNAALTNISAITNTAAFKDIQRTAPWLGDLLNPDTAAGAVSYGLIFIFIAWLAGRAVKVGIHRVLDRAERAGADPTGIRFLGQFASVSVYIFIFLIYSHLIPALHGIGTASLTSMGLVSVVVGLAAQSTLGNLISGISLVLYRPFKVGDQLDVTGPRGAETGVVENINLGNTVLRTPDDRRLVIPNSIIASQTCINRSMARKGGAANIVVVLINNADVGTAKKIMTETAKAHPKTVAVDACNVSGLTSLGTEITLSVWTGNADDTGVLKSDLLESIKTKFDAANIRIGRSIKA